MNRPNFFIVGAAKAGTTSLYYYLDQQPDVYMSPIKEPHYFCKDIRCKDFNVHYKKNVCFDVSKYLNKRILGKRHIAFIENQTDYLQLFRDRRNEKLVGEMSNGYLYSKVAANEIYKFNHDAKIVIVLRDPTDRAFSHWIMDLRGNDVCRKAFLDAIEEDQRKTGKGWGKSHLYVELGLYYLQVKRYLDVFPKKQVLIMLYEDLKDNQGNFFVKLFSFLEIEQLAIDVKQRYNVSSIPKYPAVNILLKNVRWNRAASKILSKGLRQKIRNLLLSNRNLPRLTKTDRARMRYYFEEDIGKLEQLIGRGLSAWVH